MKVWVMLTTLWLHFTKSLLCILSLCLITFSTATAQDECNNEEATCPVNPPEVTGLDKGTIESYSGPATVALSIAERFLHDRRYQQVEGILNIYDAPNGNIIRVLDEGYNFLTVLNMREDGWTQINHNEWVLSAQLTDTNHIISRFTGVLLPEPMPQYPIAWMLVNAYPASSPGEDPSEVNGLLPRYTQINIFASVEINGWTWYQIGVDKWVHQTSVARITPVERPESIQTKRWLSIDLYEQTLVAYEESRPLFATLVSTGLPRWPTHEGTFHIYYRQTRHDMSWGIPGDDFYYLEEVPWTMFFDEGRALHGAYWHDGFGYRRSHGCVNLSISDANWLYHWVAEDFSRMNSPDIEEGPAVYVYSSGEYR